MSDDSFPLGRDSFSRDVFLISLNSWDDWPRHLRVPSRHFCLLIVGDSRGVPDETLNEIAGTALDGGCVYVCAWGPDCGRVETCFDSKCAESESDRDSPVVFTVSHPGETLDEALEYLAGTAFPHAAFADTCRSSLVALVGNADWTRQVLSGGFRPDNTPPYARDSHS